MQQRDSCSQPQKKTGPLLLGEGRTEGLCTGSVPGTDGAGARYRKQREQVPRLRVIKCRVIPSGLLPISSGTLAAWPLHSPGNWINSKETAPRYLPWELSNKAHSSVLPHDAHSLITSPVCPELMVGISVFPS